MTSRSPLEATPSSFLPSPASPGVGGHPLWLSRQMRNPLSNTRALQTALALVSGDDGALEFAVGAVELGLVGQDALVEGAEADDVGLKPPVVGRPNGVEEGSVGGGGPLEGFVDPMRHGICGVSRVLGGGVNLADVREVVRAVFRGIPRHSTVVKLLDPLGRS